MSYKHGVYTERGNTIAAAPKASSIIPCYFGGAPIWQSGEAAWADKAGKAYLCSTIEDVAAKIGYYEPITGGWNKEYSLSEAAYAHFKNGLAVGPILLITAAIAPTVDATATTASVTFVNGKATIEGQDIVPATITITGKVYGTDYSAHHINNGRTVQIDDITGSLSSAQSIGYKKTVFTACRIGTAFDLLDTIEIDTGIVPSIVAAQGWEDTYVTGSTGQKVYQKLIEIAEGQINSRFNAWAAYQYAADTVANAVTEQSTKGITSAKMKGFTFYGLVGGLLVRNAARAIATYMDAVKSAGDIPYICVSNKAANIEALVTSAGVAIKITQADADTLNSIGITTCYFIRGQWRYWGNSFSNYTADGTIDAGQVDDVAIIMTDYIRNDFVRNYLDVIDTPLTRRTANELVDIYNTRLAALRGLGAIEGGTIAFSGSLTLEQALASGNFIFDLQFRSATLIKSITAVVRYNANL
ncbi:MAG: hypothetical protein WCS30_00085 [Selenomonadaceae bacterium]